MENSKLFNTLAVLNPNEFSKFGKLLRSNESLKAASFVKFYQYIKPYYPKFESSNLSKESIYEKLFESPKNADQRNRAFENKKVRKLASDLYRILEDFLIKLELENSPFQRNQLLSKALIRRGNDKYAQRIIQAEIKEREEEMHKFAMTYLELFLLKVNWFSSLKTFRFRSNEKSVEEIMLNLDLFYFNTKINLANELLNREKILENHYDICLLEEIKSIAQQLPIEHQNPLLEINLKLMSIWEANSPLEEFRSIRDYFELHLDYLPAKEQMETLQRLINYSITQYYQGHISFIQEQFELYKVGLKREIIIKDNFISDFSYTNIVHLSLLLKEYDWAKEFINKYSQLLETPFQYDATQLALANYHFSKGEFSEVINRLQHVKKFLPSYGFRMRSLLLRTYFELFLKDRTYYQMLKDNFSSFERFIKGEKNLSQERKKGYLNLSYISKDIVKVIQNGVSDQEKERLNIRLEKTRPIVTKTWLLNKIEEL